MANVQRKREYNSFPSCVIKKELSSEPAKNAYRRSYNITAEALFRLSFNVTIFADNETARALEDKVNNDLDTVAESIKEERTRLKKLMKDNGVSGDIDFPSPQEVSAQITSPAASKLFGVISELDALAGEMTILWVHGVLDNWQYTQGLNIYKRQTLKMMGRLRNFWYEARKGIQTSNKKIEREESQEAVSEEIISETPAKLKAARATA